MPYSAWRCLPTAFPDNAEPNTTLVCLTLMPRSLLPLLALGLLASFVQLLLLDIVFEKLGLQHDLVYLLLAMVVGGSVINLPLYEVAAEEAPSEDAFQQQIQRMFSSPRPVFNGRTIIAVNVGGALIPVGFAIYLLHYNALDLLQVLSAVVVVAGVAYLTSMPIPKVGVAMPFLVAPLTAALAAMLINPPMAAPLAYIAGSVGVLIGADLLRLRVIPKLGAPVASIGGAGPFDGIFLSGLFAVLLV